MSLPPDLRALLDLLGRAAAPARAICAAQLRADHAAQVAAAWPERRRPAVAEVRAGELSGPAGDIACRHYRPRQVDGSAPTVLWLHGGGWRAGDLDTADVAARLLCDAGAHVVTCAYRLAPEHRFPAGLDDSRYVLDWVHRHAAALGGDPERVAIGGDSAGGNLAAVLARESALAGRRLAGQLLVYPVLDLDVMSDRYPSRARLATGYHVQWSDIAASIHDYLGDLDGTHDPRISPIHGTVPPGLAPATIVMAEYDTLLDEALAYAEKLTVAGVSVRVELLAGMIHGALDLLDLAPWAGRAATGAITRFVLSLSNPR